MPDAPTDKFEFIRPEVGASEDDWGLKLNANWEDLDKLLAQLVDDTATPTDIGLVREERLPINLGAKRQIRATDAVVELMLGTDTTGGKYWRWFGSGDLLKFQVSPSSDPDFADAIDLYEVYGNGTMVFNGDLSFDGLVSGALEHKESGEYFRIGSAYTSSRGNGFSRIDYDPRDQFLTFATEVDKDGASSAAGIRDRGDNWRIDPGGSATFGQIYLDRTPDGVEQNGRISRKTGNDLNLQSGADDIIFRDVNGNTIGRVRTTDALSADYDLVDLKWANDTYLRLDVGVGSSQTVKGRLNVYGNSNSIIQRWYNGATDEIVATMWNDGKLDVSGELTVSAGGVEVTGTSTYYNSITISNGNMIVSTGEYRGDGGGLTNLDAGEVEGQLSVDNLGQSNSNSNSWNSWIRDRIATSNAGQVGTYAILRTDNKSNTFYAGDTFSASNLTFGGFRDGGSTGSGSVSGTWKAMGSVTTSVDSHGTLFLRIA